MVVASSWVPSGPVGEQIDEYIHIEARDASGAPVPGVGLTAVPSHGGSVVGLRDGFETNGPTAITNHQGYGTFLWTLGWTEGEQTLTVTAPGAEDLVVRTRAYPPRVKSVTLTLDDSVLYVGESTLARVTLMTTVDTTVDYPVAWQTNDPKIATVRGGEYPNQEDGRISHGRGPITVTGVSPGRVLIAAWRSDGPTGMVYVTVQPVCNLSIATSLTLGQPANGTLATTDCMREPGFPYDLYRLAVEPGQRIQVDLASTNMDPYLELLDAGGTRITGDDSSGGGTNARVTFTADAATYYLRATTIAPHTVGAYTISATVVP